MNLMAYVTVWRKGEVKIGNIDLDVIYKTKLGEFYNLVHIRMLDDAKQFNRKVKSQCGFETHVLLTLAIINVLNGILKWQPSTIHCKAMLIAGPFSRWYCSELPVWLCLPSMGLGRQVICEVESRCMRCVLQKPSRVVDTKLLIRTYITVSLTDGVTGPVIFLSRFRCRFLAEHTMHHRDFSVVLDGG